ncbi:TPA: LysR family transcriptional regulator [Citrobacter amalonaticus]|uniref:LysR family transcriptional regulator n=1 Tax=Citrobacter amalonaticus TaxID=35703 RepID=UPI000E1ABC5A|nr:LysR family transcriptional regulator [Citrobacter amalonaticus]UBI22724.1 LysR family transcriptional regulator [Citrobacter amalonaticus]SUX62927.1 LysR family transcriptional regulator [Citrobacter amalonaticus]HCB1861890.1 LysR family transcriptional regulator [Citrobacter amalonaticus]HCB1888932.1 LysR family transcriptional regulator [Citrobacter amalonaticus]HCB1911009.1 LysR family transcriptional regulator [Citrobacter amalonaticus]
MDRVMAATVFNHICDLGSLSAAARALGLSRPMVSRYLDEMEKWAGARLIHRTSRRLTITLAGEEALVKTRTLAQLSQAIGAASAADIPSGTLRVACAHFTAMHILAPMLPGFLARYPELRIEVEINNQPVSLVGERIDVAIRITDNPEPGAIARRLGDCESVLCASEAYLRQHGTPQTLEDLTQHNCLYYSGFAGKSWHFLNEQGEAVSVAIKGNLSAGISSLLCESALAGMGIALVPEKEARDGLAQGRLVRLLPTLQPRRLAVYGLYLSREHQPAGLRLFLEAIQTAMP